MVDTVYTTQELKEKIAFILKNTKVKKAILFGSYAKGKANSNSDIDILIDSDNKIIGLEFYGIWEDISNYLKKNIDLIEKKELIPGGKIEKEILKTGVVIYEK